MKTVIVGTSLERGRAAPQRGYVDVMDCLRGVRGWAIDLSAPAKPQRLELRAGDTAIASTLTNQARDDISKGVGQEVSPGFIFDPETLSLLLDHADEPEAPVTVRIAGTGCILSAAAEPPTVGALLAELTRINDPGPQTSHITDFATMLEELRSGAASLVAEGLTPLPENRQGFIETLAIDSAGQVWMVGWMRRGHWMEFAAVISDRRKTPAAVALMTYKRDDLPEDACGVIGLISSTWRPANATDAIYLFFGGAGRFHLEANRPLRILTAGELAGEYDSIKDHLLGDGRVAALQRILGGIETWGPTRAESQTYATATSIDRVLVVPGLGCLVEGWVISPMKRVQSLRLRIGGAVMTAQTDALYWKPRLDLLAGYPGSEALVRRAGFVALFAGDAEPDDFTNPVFKVVFEGGGSANWPIPASVFRRLGHSAAIEDAMRFFPALLEESFFPRFAQVAIEAERSEMNPPVKLSLTATKRALVLVLPEERCDLFLVFEELAQQCRKGPVPEGVVFVASAKANRSDALWLFRDFMANTSLKASLLVIDDASQALAQLPAILRDIGATRFVFAGAGVFLSESGWRLAAAHLQATASDLMLLGLAPDQSEHHDPHDCLSARCFGWTTPQFNRWAATAPAFLGGYYRDNGLLHTRVAHVAHRGAARASRTQLATRIEDAVNTAVYAMATRATGLAA